MKILPQAPNQFFSGSLLDPNWLNDNFSYVQDALEDVCSKRFEHTVLTYPFYADTNWSTLDVVNRSYRINPPVNILLERSFFNFYGSGSVEVRLHKMDSATGVVASDPALVVNPIHKIDCSATGSTVKKSVSVFPVLLLSGSTYQFEMSTGNTHDYAELVLHLRSDRFHTGSTNVDLPGNVSLTVFEEDDAVSATTFNDNISSLQLQAQLNITGSNNQTCLKPMLFVAKQVTSNLSSSFLTFPVPLVNSTNLNSTVRSVQAFADVSSSNSAVNFQTRVSNAALSTHFADKTATIGNGQLVGASDQQTSFALTSSLNNASSSGSLDYKVNFVFSDATAKLYKQYCYVWIE